jgi:hypothetical protein
MTTIRKQINKMLNFEDLNDNDIEVVIESKNILLVYIQFSH